MYCQPSELDLSISTWISYFIEHYRCQVGNGHEPPMTVEPLEQLLRKRRAVVARKSAKCPPEGAAIERAKILCKVSRINLNRCRTFTWKKTLTNYYCTESVFIALSNWRPRAGLWLFHVQQLRSSIIACRSLLCMNTHRPVIIDNGKMRYIQVEDYITQLLIDLH